MRHWVIAVTAAVALLSSSGAAAQVNGVAASPGITFHPPAPALPEGRVATRREGLVGLPPAPPPTHSGGRHDPSPIVQPGGDLFLAGPHTYAPRHHHRRSHFQPRFYVSPYAVPVPYFLPGDYSIALTSAVTTDRSRVEYSTVAGYLALRIEPRTAQVYVDGFFVGSADDVSGPGLALEPGPHRIELRAEGYETAAFDIRIRANDTITYTRSLERPAPAAPSLETVVAVAQPATKKTLYVIPRCFAGDRRPVASELPARCNLADLRVIPADGR